MSATQSIMGPMWNADLLERLATNMPICGGETHIEGVISAADVFGAQSVLAPQNIASHWGNNNFLCDSAIYQIIVLCCFLGYCFLAYYFRGYIGDLISAVRSKLFEDKLLNEQSYTFTLFMNCVMVLGLICFGVVTIKYVDILVGSQVAYALPAWGVHLLAPIVSVAVTLIAIYQRIVVVGVGKLTFTGQFTDRLLYLKKLLFSIYIIISLPIVMLLALNNSPMQNVFSYLFLGTTIILIIFALYKTYALFIEQNVSILHWFLYLCSVEIFPISLFVLIVLKNA